MKTTTDPVSGKKKDKKPFPIRKWLFGQLDDRALFYFGLAAGSILIAGWLIFRYSGLFHFEECAFKRVTGLYCPGCGGTRAVDALFSGHLIRSFLYHPFVLYCVVMYVLYEGSHLLEILHVPHIKGMKFRTAYVWIGLTILFLNWIVKNILLIALNI